MSKKAVLIAFSIVLATSSLLYWTLFSKPEIVVTYSLVDAAEEGIVSLEFRGTGYCSGDSIELKIKSKVEYKVNVEIEPGWVLINSGPGQNMIIAEERNITIEPQAELEVTIEAYCLDIDRANPSTMETLRLQNDTGAYRPEVANLMKFVKTAPEMRKSVSAVQIALWVLLGDISRDDILIDWTSNDIVDAKWLLEGIGMDVSGKRIIRETLERPPLPIEVTQHRIFEDEETIHVIGEIKNVGPVTLYWVEVRAILYDSSNSALGTGTTSAMRECLLSGDISPFHIEIYKYGSDRYEGFARYEVWASRAFNITLYVPYREFSVINVTVEDIDGEFRVTGEVRNTGADLTRRPKVVVSVYDETGKLTGCGYHEFAGFEKTPSFEIEGILFGTINHWVTYAEAED